MMLLLFLLFWGEEIREGQLGFSFFYANSRYSLYIFNFKAYKLLIEIPFCTLISIKGINLGSNRHNMVVKTG